MDLDMQLTRSFRLREFVTSQTAARIGRQIEPTPEELANLVRLCETVLQPLRDDVRQPLIITSGLRPRWLNELIGGSKTSAHMDGRAADFGVVGMSDALVCGAVKRLKLPVDQCILEFPPAGWCHVGIAKPGEQPRNQYLTARAVNRRTKYEQGINP